MLDHLVYLVDDLTAACDRFSTLGLPPTPGGRHTARGTHNALLRLGKRSYLELLAVDPHTKVPPPRWMGIDEGALPRISRWAVHAGAVRRTQVNIQLEAGERRLADGALLRWRLSDPGVEPAVEPVPFTIDWGESERHPAANLPDLGMALTRLELYHPEPDRVNRQLTEMGIPQEVNYKMRAEIVARITVGNESIVL